MDGLISPQSDNHSELSRYSMNHTNELYNRKKTLGVLNRPSNIGRLADNQLREMAAATKTVEMEMKKENESQCLHDKME